MKICLNCSFCNLFFIAFHLPLCFSEDALNLLKACEVSYNCGTLINISYPFWGNQRPDFCGPRKFELKCNNNRTTTIRINSLEFYVLSINQTDQLMTIARSDLFDNLCPRNQIGTAKLYVDDNAFWYTDKNRNISIWYDCPPQEGIPADFRFGCGSEKENSGRANYALEPEAMYLSRNIRGCRVKINATAVIKGWDDGGKNRTAVLETALRRGFEVEYFADAWTCRSCKESGGACGGNATQDYYCICGSGNIVPYYCPSRLNTPASGICFNSFLFNFLPLPTPRFLGFESSLYLGYFYE